MDPLAGSSPRTHVSTLPAFRVACREDESRVRIGHAAENFAVLHDITLYLLCREPTAKLGVKAKRLKCGRDDAYLLKVLLA